MSVDPQILLQQYTDGAITRHELRLRLVLAAAEQAPEQLATALPPDLLAELRHEADMVPARAEDVRAFRPRCCTGGFNWHADGAEQTRRWHTGVMAWRNYFAPSEHEA